MGNEMNILVLSCGIRNELMQYFKKELAGKGLLIATDCSELAPALYEADKFYIVPRIDDENYLNTIFDICKKENIKALFSLIDPELSILAEYSDEFLKLGATPIISNPDVVNMCFDKSLMHKFILENGYNSPKTYTDKDEFYKAVQNGDISYPVFVKPYNGSASININKVIDKREIELLFDRYDGLIIQEFMDGTEYGIDVYIDMISREPVAIFTKEKIKMRAGETDKAVSVKDEKLFDLIRSFVKKVGFIGIIDIDLFKVGDEYYISEVNPRFGGGYPHAYESGVNVPSMIINNLMNKINEEKIGCYDEGIIMMKYNSVKIMKKSGRMKW